MLEYYSDKDRTYSEISILPTFEERFDYLKMPGMSVGTITFGFDRYLNQTLYKTRIWQQVRNKVIIRDAACDLGIPGHDIFKNIHVHHMNPITVEMINKRHKFVFDEEYLITVSFDTHNAIHYGRLNGEAYTAKWKLIERKPNDTIPWR